jgi:hypothetical protein
MLYAILLGASLADFKNSLYVKKMILLRHQIRQAQRLLFIVPNRFRFLNLGILRLNGCRSSSTLCCFGVFKESTEAKGVVL